MSDSSPNKLNYTFLSFITLDPVFTVFPNIEFTSVRRSVTSLLPDHHYHRYLGMGGRSVDHHSSSGFLMTLLSCLLFLPLLFLNNPRRLDLPACLLLLPNSILLRPLEEKVREVPTGPLTVCPLLSLRLTIYLPYHSPTRTLKDNVTGRPSSPQW